MKGKRSPVTEVSAQRANETANFIFNFILFMECTEPLDKYCRALRCMFARWSPDDKVHHSSGTRASSITAKRVEPR